MSGITKHLKSISQISYFLKRTENNTKWLDELINKIEDMKNRYRKFHKFLIKISLFAFSRLM